MVSADGAMWRIDLPSVTVASRGICALELTVKGAVKDLHSGRHGGSAPNPLHALAGLVANLHDADGRAAVAGIRDGAVPPDPALREAVRAAGVDAAAYYAAIGQWVEPTLELNGLWGGYQGPGTKTVIPAAARAAVAAHLRRHCPSGCTLEVAADAGHDARACAIDPASPALAAAEAVLEELCGHRPLRVAMGAALPVAASFQRLLGLDTVFFGFATADEDYHAPDEFFRLERFRDGLKGWASLLRRLGQQLC